MRFLPTKREIDAPFSSTSATGRRLAGIASCSARSNCGNVPGIGAVGQRASRKPTRTIVRPRRSCSGVAKWRRRLDRCRRNLDGSRCALVFRSCVSLGVSQSESTLNGFVTFCYRVSLKFNERKSFVTKDYRKVFACTTINRRDQIPIHKNEV